VRRFSFLCGFENHNNINNLVKVSLIGRGFMQSNTIFTLDGARLDKAELDILHFVDSWLPDVNSWSVIDLAEKCNLFTLDATAAVDMLILNGLMENDDDDPMKGRMVYVPDIAQEWIVSNSEAIHGLYYMNDTDLFGDDETATA
jgi:hypothetical protein